ncbi:Uncharacterised protein [Stutzerimonas stutzeri]|nr:Uncharacterised protein [Stutzerimonas stutzeri]
MAQGCASPDVRVSRPGLSRFGGRRKRWWLWVALRQDGLGRISSLLRFVQKVNAREQGLSDPWEASRLESALKALVEVLEADLVTLWRQAAEMDEVHLYQMSRNPRCRFRPESSHQPRLFSASAMKAHRGETVRPARCAAPSATRPSRVTPCHSSFMKAAIRGDCLVAQPSPASAATSRSSSRSMRCQLVTQVGHKHPISHAPTS